MLLNSDLAEVFPCGFDPFKCSYKRVWLEVGKPNLIPFKIAIGKEHHPQFTKFLKSKYCIQKGYIKSHSQF